ncbi:MAG: hypothetical protein R3345_08165, partial [Fulvivirga sp.]|nr:hypothetical protein [Fulvivirga sp.]
MGAIQFPFVQTKLVNYFSSNLSEATGFEISVEAIDIDWFDQVELNGLKVIDPDGNRLFYTQSAEINFDIRALINRKNRNIDEVIVNNASLYFTKISIGDTTRTLNINALIRRVKDALRRQQKSRKFFSIDKVILNNAALTYFEDDSIKTLRKGLDAKHFSIENIHGSFRNLQTMSDTLRVQVNHLSAIEYLSGLELHNMVTDFHLSQSSMRFDGVRLEVGKSYIADTVIFNYSSTKDLSEFVDEVIIDAHLKNAKISTQDLALFTPVLERYNDRFIVNGKFEGKIKAFVLEDARVKLGKNTALRGKIRMTGLPDFQETFIDFDLDNSKVKITDLQQYLKTTTYDRLSPFTIIRLNASFLGFPNDFVAKGDFYTNFGRITSDINLKLRPNINASSYSGTLKLAKFDLGGYTSNNFFNKVTLNGKIEGNGFTLEEADFKLKGHITRIGLYGYEYSDIDTDARFTKEFFKGFLKVNDPNLKLTTTGSIDLREGINFFNINAQLDTLNLKPLNLTDNHVFLRSNIMINATGLELDSIIGQADLLDTYVEYGE